MQQISMFKADDGSIHETEEECSLRDAELQWSTDIDEFIAAGIEYKRESMVRNIVMAWERFKTQRDGKIIQLDTEDVVS